MYLVIFKPFRLRKRHQGLRWRSLFQWELLLWRILPMRGWLRRTGLRQKWVSGVGVGVAGLWECVCVCVGGGGGGGGERFKNTYELVNLRALRFSTLYKNRIFQCMGEIFCVEFQRYPLKFRTNILPMHWKMCSLLRREGLRASRFRRS